MKLSLESIERQDNKVCFFCQEPLTEENISSWETYTWVNNEQVSVKQCLICHEATNRQLSSCIKEGDTFVPQKSFEECIEEVKSQNVSLEALRAFENIENKLEV